MKHRKITTILILSTVFIGFFLTMNINFSTPQASISKTLNLSGQGGDVWFSSVSTQSVGDTFETEIYVNTSSQILGAYGFEIVYNEDVVQIASDNDVEAGDEGFVSAVNIDNDNGVVTIAGFDAMGQGPSSQLHLLTINWTAVGAGSSSLDLSIIDLADNLLDPIGTPNAIDGSIEVVEGSGGAPVLSFPVAFYYREGTTGHSITWIATDDNPTTYNITRIKMPDYQNVTQIASGSYSSGDSITITVDGLSVGTYHYTCTVYDGDGLSKSTMTMVKVIPTTLGNVWFSPVSTQTVGNTFETEIYVGTGNQNIAAYGLNITYNEDVIQIASDNDIEAGAEGFVSAVNIDNANGWVMIAGFEAKGTGPSSQLHLLSITWTTVGAGTSSLDLTIEHLVNNYTTPIEHPNAIDGSVVVERGPEITPVLNSPTDVSYQEGETGNSITWIPTDDNPTIYTITQNGTQIASGSWSSGNPITINVDGLSPDLYIYKITVYDADELTDTDSAYVLVYKVPEPPGGGEIPGYDLYIFLLSLWVTVLAIIYLRKRSQ